MTNLNPKIKHACDQCRFRKMKCDGTQPCQRCLKMDFTCSFYDSHRPRNVKSNRVNLLREVRSSALAETTSVTNGNSRAISSPVMNSETTETQSSGSGSSELLTQRQNENSFAVSEGMNHAHGDGNDQSSQIDMSLQQAHLRVEFPNSNLAVSPWSPTIVDDAEVTDNAAPDFARHSLVPGLQAQLCATGLSDNGQVEVDLNSSEAGSSDLRDPFATNNSPHQASSVSRHWPKNLREEELLQCIEVFFGRVHSTLPIVDRIVLYEGLILRRHHEDAGFGSMILSLCAFSLVQPVYVQEYASMSLRIRRAKEMLSAAIQLRSPYSFGEGVTLDDVTTSFFMFATLLGMELHNAAWLKLREAVECGKFLGLDQPERYKNLTVEENSRRLRVFLVLSVTERGFALQRNHSISFTGRNIQRMQGVVDLIQNATVVNSFGIVIQDGRNATLLFGLLQLMKLFDSIDEEIIPCWNKSCSSSLQSCAKLDMARVIKVHDAIQRALVVSDRNHRPNPGSQPYSTQNDSDKENDFKLDRFQWADCFVLQQWLLIRLWASCLTHDLLDETSELEFLRPSYAATVADYTLQECQQLALSVLEAHGTGMVERMYDIAMGVVMAMQLYTMFRTRSPDSHSWQVLEHYFDLLGRLRGGAHPFSEALRGALGSFDGDKNVD